MPRRLGDDPLSRKRSPSPNEKDVPSARPGFPAHQASHNDVFFQRRIEGPRPKPENAPDNESSLGETASNDEKPEITEVSDIVRTAKVAESTQGAEQLARPVPMDESIHTPAEKPVEKTEQTPPTVEPVTTLESPAPTAPASSQPEQQGLLKRLFGRFGK